MSYRNCLTRKHTFALTIVLAVCSRGAAGVTVVEVNNGDTLTQDEIELLRLGPDLRIEIHSGGTLGRLGTLTVPFDLEFTTINLNSGGVLKSSNSPPAARSRISNVILSLFNGGQIEGGAYVGGASQLFLEGGSIASFFDLGGTSVLEATAGSIASDFDALDSARVLLSGASIHDRFRMYGNTHLELSGTGSIRDDFQMFGFSTANMTGGTIREGARLWQDSTLTLAGGTIQSGLLVNDRATFNMTGGQLQGSILANDDAIIHIQDSTIGNLTLNQRATAVLTNAVTNPARTYDDSSLFVQSGMFQSLESFDRSQIEFRGGSVVARTTVTGESHFQLSGGALGDRVTARDRATFEIFGGEFRLDGVLIESLLSDGSTLDIDIPTGSVLSGVLSDGTPFAFSDKDAYNTSTTNDTDADAFALGSLTLHTTTLPAPGAAIIYAATDPVPTGLRGGQTIIVEKGGALPINFGATPGNTIIVRDGGFVGKNLEVIDSIIDISGGMVDVAMDAFGNSQVNITGGDVRGYLGLFDTSSMVISGGVIGMGDGPQEIVTFDNSTLSVTGNAMLGDLEARGASQVSITGMPELRFLRTYDDADVVIDAVGDFRGSGAYGNSSLTLQRIDSFGPIYAADQARYEIYDGQINDNSELYNHSIVNFHRGNLGDRTELWDSSVLNMFGGSIGDHTQLRDESILNLYGSDFAVDGVPIGDLLEVGESIVLPAGDGLFTGVLSDGTPIAFVRDLNAHGESLSGGTVRLIRSEVAPIGPATIVASSDDVPYGIRDGQTLVVDDGAAVEKNFNAGFGSAVIVDQGGTIAHNFEALGADVQVTGGTIGTKLGAMMGTTVTMTDGSIGDDPAFLAGSTLILSGGEVGRRLVVRDSLVYMSGGSIQSDMSLINDCEFYLSGGTIGPGFAARTSHVEVIGGEIQTMSSTGTVMIRGGTIGYLSASDAFVEMSGGELGDHSWMHGNTVLEYSGGEIGDGFRLEDQAILEITGTEFYLDGVPLIINFHEPYLLLERNVMLQGALLDGTFFDFELNTQSSPEDDYFENGTTIHLILIPAPSGAAIAFGVAGLCAVRRRSRTPTQATLP